MSDLTVKTEPHKKLSNASMSSAGGDECLTFVPAIYSTDRKAIYMFDPFPSIPPTGTRLGIVGEVWLGRAVDRIQPHCRVEMTRAVVSGHRDIG